MHAELPRRTVELPGPASGTPLRAVVLGERGPLVTYFASSGGDETEFERYAMHRVCAARIRAGALRVVAVDARGPATLWDDAIPAAERFARHAALHRDLRDVLMPWLHGLAGVPRLTFVGASYGAHVAANLWLDRPGAVSVVCGLGGVYGLRHRMVGLDDPAVAALTPLERVPARTDVSELRRTEGLVLYAAADDGWLDSSRGMAAALAGRSLPHTLEIWPSPADHHERWWRDQLVRFLRRRFGEPPVAG